MTREIPPRERAGYRCQRAIKAMQENSTSEFKRLKFSISDSDENSHQSTYSSQFLRDKSRYYWPPNRVHMAEDCIFLKSISNEWIQIGQREVEGASRL